MLRGEDFTAAGRLTRRQALARGGLALGALGLASAGFARPLAAAVPSRRDGFDAARRSVYVALVGAVAALPERPVDGHRADWAANRLAADYASRLPESRRAIDDVLDALDDRGFARMGERQRVALLREWAAGGPDGRGLAEYATAIAAGPFAPEPESEDDVIKPVPVVV